MTFKQWIESKAKAFVGAIVATAGAYLFTVLVDPTTPAKIEGVLPEQWKWVVPVIIGGIVYASVHQVPNKQPDGPDGAGK